ncbi:MAG: hypothetical protein JNM06_05500, partial [Blastocatellia bacterium]|nr:hypothetical protein [Blastocatellia bacterium]
MPAQKPWYKNPVIMVPAVVVVIGAVIGLIGSISSPLVTEWYKKIYDPEKKTIDIYRVRVTVIDPQKIPVEDASVRSTMSNEAKKIDGGWQIDIPYVSKPKDSK